MAQVSAGQVRRASHDLRHWRAWQMTTHAGSPARWSWSVCTVR